MFCLDVPAQPPPELRPFSPSPSTAKGRPFVKGDASSTLNVNKQSRMKELEMRKEEILVNQTRTAAGDILEGASA